MSTQPKSLHHTSSSREVLATMSAVLGWLEAAILLLMVSYMLSTYYALSAISPMNQLFLEVLVAACLVIISAIVLVVGSFMTWKTKPGKGGVSNLLAGTLVPIPTLFYFTFLSKPSLLGWLLHLLGPISLFLLAPGILSGVIGIYIQSQHSASPTPSS